LRTRSARETNEGKQAGKNQWGKKTMEGTQQMPRPLERREARERREVKGRGGQEDYGFVGGLRMFGLFYCGHTWEALRP